MYVIYIYTYVYIHICFANNLLHNEIIKVCGGTVFGIMLAVEVFMLATSVIGYEKLGMGQDFNIDDICLRVQAIVIIPSEIMYAVTTSDLFHPNFNSNCVDSMIVFCFGFSPCGCCYTPSILLSLLSSLCPGKRDRPYAHPSIRIGLSMVEWIFVIIWAIVLPERGKFLFSVNYGLAAFIVSGICYFIHSQYLYFFPNFSLPDGVSIRSIFGYAFNGELEEIQRLKQPKQFDDGSSFEWDDDDPANSKLPKWISENSLHAHAFYGRLSKVQWYGKNLDTIHGKYNAMTPIVLAMSNKQYEIVDHIMSRNDGWRTGKPYDNLDVELAREFIKADYWDRSSSLCYTPAMYALSMGQYHVVEYLEQEKGAKLHRLIFNKQTKFKSMNEQFARDLFGKEYFSI